MALQSFVSHCVLTATLKSTFFWKDLGELRHAAESVELDGKSTAPQCAWIHISDN